MTICWFGNDNLFQPKIFYILFQVFLSNLDSIQIIYEDNDSLQTLWPIWRYPSPEKLKIYLLPPHLAQAEGLKEGSFFLFLIRWEKGCQKYGIVKGYRTDIKRIAKGSQKESKSSNSIIFPFNYPFAIRLRSFEEKILKELMHLQDVQKSLFNCLTEYKGKLF